MLILYSCLFYFNTPQQQRSTSIVSLECPQCYHADMNRTSMVLKWGPTSVEGLSQEHVHVYGHMQHLHWQDSFCWLKTRINL